VKKRREGKEGQPQSFDRHEQMCVTKGKASPTCGANFESDYQPHGQEKAAIALKRKDIRPLSMNSSRSGGGYAGTYCIRRRPEKRKGRGRPGEKRGIKKHSFIGKERQRVSAQFFRDGL